MIFKALFGRKDVPAADVGGTKELLTLARKLDVPRDRAFAVFVDELERWWPREFTLGRECVDKLGIQPRYGGRFFEMLKDGTRTTFGTVLAFERPSHVVFSWQMRADRAPEASEGTSSRVDVRFVDREPGTSEILVVHRDFFRHGEDFEAYRNQMAGKKGWPAIIEAYVRALAA